MRGRTEGGRASSLKLTSLSLVKRNLISEIKAIIPLGKSSKKCMHWKETKNTAFCLLFTYKFLLFFLKDFFPVNLSPIKIIIIKIH